MDGVKKNVMVNLYVSDLEYAAQKARECGITRSELVRVALMHFRQEVQLMEAQGGPGAFKTLWREVMDAPHLAATA